MCIVPRPFRLYRQFTTKPVCCDKYSMAIPCVFLTFDYRTHLGQPALDRFFLLTLLSLLAGYSLERTYKLFDLCTAAFGAFLFPLVFLGTQDTFEFLPTLCALVLISCHCSTSTPISHTVNHACPRAMLSTTNHLWIKRPVFGIII